MRTMDRIDQYHGKLALLQTWENLSAERQEKDALYLLELRRRVRQIRNYIEHRAGAEADIT